MMEDEAEEESDQDPAETYGSDLESEGVQESLHKNKCAASSPALRKAVGPWLQYSATG